MRPCRQSEYPINVKLRVWTEKYGQYVAHTIVGYNAVYYDVCEATHGEEVMVWEKTVQFGRDKAHRAGGVAFRNAAHEQEATLHKLGKEVN